MSSLPRYLVLGAAGLLMAGCAGSWATSELWSKGGATQEAAVESLRQCAEQAEVALRTPVDAGVDLTASRRTNGTQTSDGEVPNDSPSARRDRLIGRCMIMRGYLIER
jgi:hypothetical protein